MANKNKDSVHEKCQYRMGPDWAPYCSFDSQRVCHRWTKCKRGVEEDHAYDGDEEQEDE